MIVELISVGTEILLGNIVNTNAAYLAEKCAALGLSCYYQTVVGDNADRLFQTIETAKERADVIILSGGLGPTQDDLTKETAAKVFGKKLYLDEHSKERIAAYFKKRGIEITENNWKQAMMPEGAIVIDNENGTAPGVILRDGEKHVLLLPGPPNELIPMFENSMIPYLKNLVPEVIVSKTVKLCGIGESTAETMIEDLLDSQNPTVAPYAKTAEVHLRVTAKAEDEKAAKRMIKPVVWKLQDIFGDYIYTTDEKETLEESVVALLKENDYTITTVESCTGGMLAGRLINVSGVSKVFKSGFVTYANKAKHKLVGVKKSHLKKYGAVSEEVAADMVKGAYAVTGSDVVVSITGIAGPDGGTKEKPVGLVYIACMIKGEIFVKKFHFNGNRSKIRETTVANALVFMRECILKNGGKRKES